MILIFTFKDKNGVECIDFGINLKDDSHVVLPQYPIFYYKEDLKWVVDLQQYYI